MWTGTRRSTALVDVAWLAPVVEHHRSPLSKA